MSDSDSFPPLYQLRAVFTKNVALQRKSKLQLCCVVLTPLLMTVFMGVIDVLIQLEIADLGASTVPYDLVETAPFSQRVVLTSGPVLVAPLSPGDIDVELGSFEALNVASGLSGAAGLVAIAETYGGGNLDEALSGLANLGYITDGNVSEVVGLSAEDTLSIAQGWTINKTADGPSFTIEQYADEASFEDAAFEDYRRYEEQLLADPDSVDAADAPQGAFLFSELTAGGDVHVLIRHHAEGNPFRVMVGWLLDALALLQGGSTTRVKSMEMPEEEPRGTGELVDISWFVGPTFVAIALGFIIPTIAMRLVSEKELGLIEMMKIAGLDESAYWLNNVLFDMLTYTVQMLIVFIVAAAFDLSIVAGVAFHLNLLLYLGWGVSQVGLSYLYAAFFGKQRTVMLFTFVVSLLTAIVLLPVLSAAYPNLPPTEWTIVPTALYLYPPIAFVQGVAYLAYACSGPLGCPASFSDVPGLADAVVMLFVMGLIYGCVGIYLSLIIPTKWGVKRHPLFFLRTRGDAASEHDVELKVTTHEDDDVAAEADRVLAIEDHGQHGVVVNTLVKQFGVDKTAVAGVRLALDTGKEGTGEGHIFGLLGGNGAGKTTLISCLTGMLEPSSGGATVAGANIRTNMRGVQKRMGLCPQHDILWPTLTVAETLTFYANLKGLFGRDAEATVTATLEQVELDEAKGKRISQLSGGMRRRVSVACALTGDPAVIFFDEPSSGLDVSTQRSLWKALLDIKRGRCIILTTHSMEEADALSDRIGIMSRGRLRALGTPAHLKSKFGSGYRLEITFDLENEEKATAYLMSLVPSARLEEAYPGKRSFRVSHDEFVSERRLSAFFDGMQGHGKEHGVSDFGLSVSSLEDVFLRLAAEDDE